MTSKAQNPAGILEMRGISKVFGSVRALTDLDFTVRPGEIHALIGENGAGKSTLIKVMTGALEPDQGTISLDGKPIRPKSPRQAQELGISCVYQEVNLLPNLSVAENVMLGRVAKRIGGIDWPKVRAEAHAALRILNVNVDVALPLQSCSIAVQQLVAIARAVALNARVLVLDEPTSSLDESEVESLFEVLRRLRSEGIAIVFISHFLDQVDAIADRVTILRNGLLVGEFVPSQLTRLELISKMVGKEFKELTEVSAGTPPASGETPLLEVKGLKRGRFGPIDFAVHKGEALGFAGLLGSGRTETARMLFGLDPAGAGSIRVKGEPRSIRSPRNAMRLGIGYLPEDRKLEAIIPSLSIRENLVLALQARRGWLRPIPFRQQVEIGERYKALLGIATDSLEKPISHLSGGNQQKVLLARWLSTEPQLLILDEPTRGIDVGARAEIEQLIRSLCRDGMAVVMISSELDELLRCAHRLLVLRDGKAIGNLPGGASAEEVMHLIAGGAPL